MAPSPVDRIVVGIDFGTTFSGVAFTYSGIHESPDEISVVKDWPGGNNITSDKVPSELSYRASSSSNGSGQDVCWGYQLKPEQPRLRCLKLLLDPRQETPSYVSGDNVSGQLHQYGKTVEEAIADYLTMIHEQAKDALVKRYGQHMVSTTKLDFVLTVPAVWSDAAKDATWRAAVRAGMTEDLRMVSEPEAAATYALKSMEHTLLHVGDNFIVCDAGGGTVDLISYEIASLSPLQLQESVPGTGGLCGGVFLNLRFEELVKTRMGSEAFQSLCKRKPRSWAIALRYFEDYVKRNFNPADTQEEYDDNKFNVPLPGVDDDAAAGIDCGFIMLSTADVAEIFRPVINSVIDLVERQRNTLTTSGKSAKGVVLVGGFGQSNHLFKALKLRFANENPPASYSPMPARSDQTSNSAGLLIMQPTNAWTAVVRGAVLDSLETLKLVTSRKSRRHYGVRCNSLFDPSKHSTKNKFWDSLRCEFRANNQVSWHVKKGRTLPTAQAIELPFSHDWDYARGFPSSIACKIVVSDALEAPTEFESTPDTRILCLLHVSLAKVPVTYIKACINSCGNQYRSLDYEIGMTTNSGGLHFDLRVDGIVYGTVQAEYE